MLTITVKVAVVFFPTEVTGEDWVDLCLWWCGVLWDVWEQEIRTAAVSLNATTQTGYGSEYRKWGQSPIAQTTHTHTHTQSLIFSFGLYLLHTQTHTHTTVGAVIFFSQGFLWIHAQPRSQIIIVDHSGTGYTGYMLTPIIIMVIDYSLAYMYKYITF